MSLVHAKAAGGWQSDLETRRLTSILHLPAVSRPSGAATTTAAGTSTSAPAPGSVPGPEAGPAPGFPFPPPWMGMPLPPPFGKLATLWDIWGGELRLR